MKLARSLSLLCAAGLVAVVGCNNNKKTATGPANPSVADIRPVNAAPAPAPMPVQPVQPIQPVVSDTPPTVTQVASATPQITGSTYTIQKGDTLYKVARAKYGDQSAVKRIVAANPGLSPNTIKVGQKINLP
jgi:5'-nucleotidase / UDP-sugar diphosphatase